MVFRRNGTERGYRKLTASEGMGFIRILHRGGGVNQENLSTSPLPPPPPCQVINDGQSLIKMISRHILTCSYH